MADCNKYKLPLINNDCKGAMSKSPRAKRKRKEYSDAFSREQLEESEAASQERLGPFDYNRRMLQDVEIQSGLDWLNHSASFERIGCAVLPPVTYEELIFQLQISPELFSKRYFATVTNTFDKGGLLHWMALLYRKSTLKLFIIDPLPSSDKENCQPLIKKRFEAAFSNLNIVTQCSGFQTDSYNCGPLSLSILEDLVRGIADSGKREVRREINARESRKLWNRRLYMDGR